MPDTKNHRRSDTVDRSSEDSFPASDPPSWIPVNGSAGLDDMSTTRFVRQAAIQRESERARD